MIFLLAKECLSEFKMECDLRRLSKKTVKWYFNNCTLFLNYVEAKYKVVVLEEIRPPHLKSYFQYLIEKGLSASYANGILKSLRAFFKYATDEGYILDNIALKVRWQIEGKVLINTFTDDEVKRLLGVYKDSTFLSLRNKLILAIAFDTGVRNSEICALCCEDIKSSVLLIHGKGNKERHVPLTPYVSKLMRKYERVKEKYFFDHRIDFNNYFLSRTGRPLTKEAVEHVFNQANEKAQVRSEIRCSPHTARHYYAQTNLRNGLDVYSLSRLLGHENVNITKRYLQSMQDESIVILAAKSSPLSNLKL